MRLAIIIPTVNQTVTLKKLLASLSRQLVPQTEVIIVFNGTSQVNQDLLQKFCQQQQLPVRFLVSQRPQGFSRAVNRGIRAAQSELVILMNDDLVLAPGYLQALIKFYQKHRRRRVYGQALVLNQQGKIDTAGGQLLPQGKVKMLKYSNTQMFNPPAGGLKIQLVSATLAFYPKKFFDQVGLFDECFGSYLEDVDLSLRANSRGWQGYLVPQAQAAHLGQATSRKRRAYKQWHDFKNWLIIIVKHRRLFDWKHNWRAILIERLRNLSGLIKALIRIDDRRSDLTQYSN